MGTVRDNDAERDVTALSCSVHPSAEKELRRVAEETAAECPDAVAIAPAHRATTSVWRPRGGRRRVLRSTARKPST